MFDRVFLLVLDGLGIGGLDDKANTLKHVIGDKYNLDLLEVLGLTRLIGSNVENTRGIYMRAVPQNKFFDSLNGHYEMMCGIPKVEYETYKDGFPLELISKIQRTIGVDIIGNKKSDGIEIINELGQMHIKTGCPIIYSSDDSVLQVAAHEDVIPVDELYKMCEKIFELVNNNEYKIARVIARPFTGKEGDYTRTNKRRDYTCTPPINVLDYLDKAHIQTICIGKVGDLFNNKGINVNIRTTDNIDTMMKVIDFSKGSFNGLLFANFNDFDSEYGHRKDREGYLKALEEFNYYLPILLKNLKKKDLLIITADHGCDPTLSGSHTKEMVPLILYCPLFKKGKKMPHRETLADIGATILDNFNIKNTIGIGKSIFDDLRN